MKVIFIPSMIIQEQTNHFPAILSLQPRCPRPHTAIWSSVSTFLCNPQKLCYPHPIQLHGSTITVSLQLNHFAGFFHFTSFLCMTGSLPIFWLRCLTVFPPTHMHLFPQLIGHFLDQQVVLWGFHVDDPSALSVTYVWITKMSELPK